MGTPLREVTKERLGTPGWTEAISRTRGPFQSLSNPGSCPFRFKLVSHVLVDGKPGLPGPGEKIASIHITCEPGVLPVLGSAEVQHVQEAFPGASDVHDGDLGAFSGCTGVKTPISTPEETVSCPMAPWGAKPGR